MKMWNLLIIKVDTVFRFPADSVYLSFV